MKWYNTNCDYCGGTGYLFGDVKCPMCGKKL